MKLAQETLNTTQSAIPDDGKKQEIIVFKHFKKETIANIGGARRPRHL